LADIKAKIEKSSRKLFFQRTRGGCEPGKRTPAKILLELQSEIRKVSKKAGFSTVTLKQV